MNEVVPQDSIDTRILTIRGKKVMLDKDLAVLYGVETRALNQAVRRNVDRFPEDFMFEVAREELDILKSQYVTSSWGGTRKPPLAFTEQGVAMLSSVLRSGRAVTVNIQIMRAFVRIRTIAGENADLRKAIKLIESRLDVHDRQIQIAFSALQNMLKPTALPAKERKIRIGFGPGDRKVN